MNNTGWTEFAGHVGAGNVLDETGRAIIAEIHDFVGDGPQEDDMCLVCYKRLS